MTRWACALVFPLLLDTFLPPSHAAEVGNALPFPGGKSDVTWLAKLQETSWWKNRSKRVVFRVFIFNCFSAGVKGAAFEETEKCLLAFLA